MKKIRVLVVDDSVVIRKLISEGLAKNPSIEICGSAANGSIALQKIAQCNPDLVTMDIDMPDMDGVQAVRELRKRYSRLPVIMVSALTERGATATLDALSAGASDYVTKPASVGILASRNGDSARMHDELASKVKALCPDQPAAGEIPRPASPKARNTTPAILAIGCSTGGPNALAELIPALPASLPVPVVIVQHMPPVFTKMLAERLDGASALRVEEAQDGMKVAPGLAVIAPGDFHMVLLRTPEGVEVRLHQGPPENSCRPSVDVLFRSAAAVYGGATLGVVLTGMGQDGLRGCEKLSAAGGQILVQNEATSVVWGMPGFVARAGLANDILPLQQIAFEVTRRIRAGNITRAGEPRPMGAGR